MAFATVDDLMAGWRQLDLADQAAADALLQRASALIASLMERRGLTIDSCSEIQRLNLSTVCCSMVRRSMSTAVVEGIGSMTHSIGSASQSVTYSNPDGALYLTGFEKELLGLNRKGSLRQLRAAIREPDGSPAEGW